MLTKEEKNLILKMLEEDLRQYVTEEEWKEYIPKLLKYFKFVPSRKQDSPNDYIMHYFVWKDSKEGENYWRDWSQKVCKRIWWEESTKYM